MRVAVIFDNFGPYHLARLSAAAQRCDIVAIETAGKSGEYAWDSGGLVEGVSRTTLLPGTSGDYSARDIARAMEGALGALRPHVIAIPGWHDRAGLSALRWARRHHIPVVIMSDSNADDAPRIWFREIIKRQVVSLCSSGLTAGSRAAHYLEQLGMSRDVMSLGYDTVDNVYFAAGAAVARADPVGTGARLHVPERYLLACSRFVAKKNLPFLITAYAAYAKGRGAAALPLVLLGDGELRDGLYALARQQGVEKLVHFPGFVRYHEMPAYYGLAVGFVLASTVDQWGLVVNEAMAAGLPVLVSSRCGCATDLVVDGDNGFTFDPTDSAALVQGFEAVAHGDNAAAMGARSKEIIADWGVDRFAAGLIEAAQCALDRPLPRGALLAHATLGALLI